MSINHGHHDPQALVYAEEIRKLYRRERARADELARAKDELESAHRRLVAEMAEHEQAEAQLRQSQKMEAIGQLAGGIAHDFNNLLSVIINCAHFVAEELEEGSPILEDIREIRDAGQRAADLTRQLLTFSRKEAICPRVVDVTEILTRLEKMLSRVLTESIQLTLRASDATWPVKIDPGQFEQIVLNLVVNARDAIPGGGSLTIRSRNHVVDEMEATQHPGLSAGEYAALTVKDTGHGMDPDLIARIYEPFFTTKERGSGTGLGLATVYGIVKRADGYIMCESEPGKGTQFTVLLPRSMDSAEDLPSRSAEPTRRVPSEKILVVDDEDGVRRVVERLLTAQGYPVVVAASGDEALALLREVGEIEAVVADLIMPGLSGAGLVEASRSLRPGLPMVVMSGYSEEILTQHGGIGSDVPMIHKPFSPQELLTALENALSGSARGTRL